VAIAEGIGKERVDEWWEVQRVGDLGRNIPDGFPKGSHSISSDAYNVHLDPPGRIKDDQTRGYRHRSVTV